jgi:fimbrial chaperone protein
VAPCNVTRAGSIAVSPVNLDIVTVADAATSVTVTNSGTMPENIQVRAMRWTQSGGMDRLEPSDDVVVSPPIALVRPGTDQVVRIVRMTQRPVVGEEAYRLLVDELPTPARMASSSVSLVVRQSIPVFFRSPSAMAQPLSFMVKRQESASAAIAINHGDVHEKLTMLAIKDNHGAVQYSRSGLLGYVLGKSSFSWPVPVLASAGLRFEGRTEHGPIKLIVAATQ